MIPFIIFGWHLFIFNEEKIQSMPAHISIIIQFWVTNTRLNGFSFEFWFEWDEVVRSNCYYCYWTISETVECEIAVKKDKNCIFYSNLQSAPCIKLYILIIIKSRAPPLLCRIYTFIYGLIIGALQHMINSQQTHCSFDSLLHFFFSFGRTYAPKNESNILHAFCSFFVYICRLYSLNDNIFMTVPFYFISLSFFFL